MRKDFVNHMTARMGNGTTQREQANMAQRIPHHARRLDSTGQDLVLRYSRPEPEQDDIHPDWEQSWGRTDERTQRAGSV